MHIDGNSYWTVTGQLDGKQITHKPTVVEGKNLGKSNERTGEAQALSEAQAKWDGRKESGYFENIEDIDNEYYVEPMLAKNWSDRKDKVIFPVYCQRKYDGARCITSLNGTFSRNGKQWKTTGHIIEALMPVFEKYPDLVLDGELYCHDLHDNFEKIMSLIKKTKPTREDLQESAKTIQYHVYDIVDTALVFSVRNKMLKDILSTYEKGGIIVIVPTFKCNNIKELDELYEKFMAEGYEGQMIRLDEPYENKRSANLLKRKEFLDSEYKILDIIEGVGNRVGMVGSFVLENDSKKYENFSSNVKGSYEYLTEIWQNRKKYIGKYATVKYFGIGAHGAPRFPFVIKIRDGKGID